MSLLRLVVIKQHKPKPVMFQIYPNEEHKAHHPYSLCWCQRTKLPISGRCNIQPQRCCCQWSCCPGESTDLRGDLPNHRQLKSRNRLVHAIKCASCWNGEFWCWCLDLKYAGRAVPAA